MLNTKRLLARLSERLPLYVALMLMVYMPFHIFLSQWLSVYTGGLEVWKVAKDVLLAVVVLFVICSVWITGRATRIFQWLVGLTILYAVFHGVLWAFNTDIYQTSALVGSVYNLRVPAFAILGYGAALLWPVAISGRSIMKIVLIVSAIVAFLGVLQYFLPKDILTHFGYGIDRGVRPAFFIDDKAGFPRIMSTLREPNALGSYLLVPLTLLSVLWFKVKESRQKLVLAGAFGLHALAIFLTFSRSAWIGAVLAVGLGLAWQYKAWVMGIVRRWWPVAAGLLLVFSIVAYVQRDHSFVESYISHTSDDGDLSSNDYHWLFFKQGVEGIIAQPFGHGPGTAGLASIQNPEGSFLTENYYVQVGYEVGIFGLLIFLAINVLLYKQLWQRRTEIWPTVLLARFWAYVLINMLLHIWSNEAVACQWWILAGLVLGISTKQNAAKN